MRNKQAGFTLIESLIVIFIISLLAVICVPLSAKHIEKQREHKFFQLLDQDLLYLQNACMSTFGKYDLYMHQNYYLITHIDQEVLRRDLPAGYRISVFNGLNKFSFTDSGSIKKSGSMAIYTKNNVYTMYLPPGKGRARYEKR